MKFKFNLKNQEASIEADVEGLVEKGLERRANPDRKTRYQIKQEEKRKNEELKQKHLMQMLAVLIGFLVLILIICFIGAALEG